MYNVNYIGRCDGIGRRSGLKIHRWRQRTGSSPVTGTNSSQAAYRLRRAFSFHCKTYRALILLRLASKPNPLPLGFGLVLGTKLRAGIDPVQCAKKQSSEVLHLIGKRSEPPGALPVRNKRNSRKLSCDGLRLFIL